MIPYFAHASILLAASFFLYWLLLRKETFFKVNRLFLAMAIVLSALIPLVDMPAFLSFHEVIEEPISRTDEFVPESRLAEKNTAIEPTKNIELSPNEPPSETLTQTSESELSFFQTLKDKWTLSQVLWGLYFTGVLIFTLTFFIQFILLLFKKSKLEYMQDGKYRIYELTDNSPPFSFLTWIFINPTLYDYDTFEQIIEHEKIHVSQAHYIDKMLAELAVIFYWFNPFVWFHRDSIANNLEFLTDEEMLTKGTERESYQMSLLKVSVPEHSLNLTTNYNESFLSERIRMMNAKKSSAKSSWKYLLIFPVIGFSMATLNAVKPTLAKDINTISGLEEVDTNAEEQNKKTKNSTTITTTTSSSNEALAENNQLVQEQSVAKEELPNTSADDIVKEDENIGEQNNRIVMEQTDGYDGNIDLLMNELEQVGEKKQLEKEFGKEWGKKFAEELEHEIAQTIEKAKNASGQFNEFSQQGNSCSSSKSNYKSTKESCNDKSKKNSCAPNSVTTMSKKWTKADIDPGHWLGLIKGDDVCFYLDNSNRRNNVKWTINECFSINEIQGFSPNGDSEFKIVRDAGTLKMDGTFTDGEGVGLFEFVGDQSFVDFLRKEDINGISDKDLFHLFFNNTDKRYVKNLKKGSYAVSSKDLISLGIHQVSSEDVEEYNRVFNLIGESGSCKKMINFAIHKVDETFVRDLLQIKSADLSSEKIISAKIHGVTKENIDDLKKYGYEDINLQDVINMSIHGSFDNLENLSNSGYTNVSPQEMNQFAIHGVTPEFIEQLADLGYDDLSPHYLKQFAIHGLTTNDIKQFQKIGFNELSPKDLIDSQVHGVSPRFVRDIKDLGYDDLTMKDYINFIIHGVDSDYIYSFQKLGFRDLSAKDLQHGKIHGVTGNYVKELRREGIKNMTFGELKKAKIQGVSGSFIRKARSKGYNYSTLREYTKLKIRGLSYLFRRIYDIQTDFIFRDA